MACAPLNAGSSAGVDVDDPAPVGAQQLLAAETCHAVENFTLPAGGQDGGVVLLLVVRYVFDSLHALLEQRHELVVDLVQLGPGNLANP